MRSHTLIAGLVIASFVALQTNLFFEHYALSGRIRTETAAIVLARTQADCGGDQFPAENWRAVFSDGRWTAHAEVYDGLFGGQFSSSAVVVIDAASAKTIRCSVGVE